MIIYHYTNKDNLKEVNPLYFGNNCYTLNDKKIPINRAFFYTEPKPEKYLKNSKCLYLCQIDNKCLYDLRIDNDNLKQKFLSIEDLLNKIIGLGYKGIIYNVGFDIVSLFETIPINKKINL